MKNYLILALILCLSSGSILAEEVESSSSWGSDTSVFNSGFTGQKPVTDNKLNKTIEMLKERSLTKKQKKTIKEVQPMSPSSDFEHLKLFTEEQAADSDSLQSHTVMIPMVSYSHEGGSIQPGYYKLSCRKLSESEYVLDLSQGTRTMLTVNAQQTQQDLKQQTLSFGNAEIIENNRIRLVYGSIDLNLVGYLYFK